jgi:hypothetical protein
MLQVRFDFTLNLNPIVKSVEKNNRCNPKKILSHTLFVCAKVNKNQFHVSKKNKKKHKKQQ